MMWDGITKEQHEQLLKPLAASRVAKRKQAGIELSYLEAWDVKAHLIRIFGFGGWSADVQEAVLAFEEKNEKGQWSVGYRVRLMLRVDALACSYTEVAVGFAALPSRGEAHDMAVKTAESDALKRAAINLGTQFGLSLYDNGRRTDVVGHTLAGPVVDPKAPVDVSGLVVLIADATDEDKLRAVWDSALDVLDEVTATGDTVRSLIVDRLAVLRGTDE